MINSDPTSVIRIAVLCVAAACSLIVYRFTPIQRLISDYIDIEVFAISIVTVVLCLLHAIVFNIEIDL